MIRAGAALLAAALCGGAAAAEEWRGSYPEGPVWIGETLYWAEMGADRIMIWPGQGEPRAFMVRDGCGPTALARYREDEFLVLCHRAGELVRLDADGRELGAIAGDAAGDRLRNPNDASADGEGGVWFSDPGAFRAGAPAEGALYHLAPDGALTRRVSGLAYGNGVFVDRQAGRLLVSEHLARRVLAFPLVEGALGEPRILFDLDALGLPRPDYAEAGPDGLEIAPDGTLWVAEYGAGRLLAWRPGEGLVRALPTAAQFVTNIAFGPEGQAAVTAPFVNDRPPFAGGVYVLPASDLAAVEAIGGPRD